MGETVDGTVVVGPGTAQVMVPDIVSVVRSNAETGIRSAGLTVGLPCLLCASLYGKPVHVRFRVSFEIFPGRLIDTVEYIRKRTGRPFEALRGYIFRRVQFCMVPSPGFDKAYGRYLQRP